MEKIDGIWKMNFFDALHEKFSRLEFTYNVILISMYTRNFGFKRLISFDFRV